MKKIISASLLLVIAVFAVTVNSCKKEEATPAPVACIQADTVLTVNESATFTSCATNATSYNWNFGDGQTASTNNTTHTYTSTGTYTVTLTVTGKGGSDTKTITVHVSVPVSSFIGTYNCSEACNSGNYTYNMTVATTGTNTISMQNFGSFGTTAYINATVSGYNIIIPSQTAPGVTELHGNGSINEALNNVTITYTYTAGGTTESCTLSGAKQ